MLYLIAVFLGVIAGLVAGGNISNIINFRIQKIWIILLAFSIQIFSQIMCYNGFKFFSYNSFIIHAIVYFMLFLAFWFNRHYLGILLIASGSILNMLVMMLNGGKMPVSLDVIQAENLKEAAELINKGLDSKHTWIDETTRLAFLGDTIHPPSFLSFLMEIVSIGDLVIIVGLAVIVFEMVTEKTLVCGKCSYKS